MNPISGYFYHVIAYETTAHILRGGYRPTESTKKRTFFEQLVYPTDSSRHSFLACISISAKFTNASFSIEKIKCPCLSYDFHMSTNYAFSVT